MDRLGQLTASRETCNELVELGIEERAFLWHSREGIDAACIYLSDWEVKPLTDPIGHPEFCVPAWTKEELDVMIGPNRDKPDLFTDRELGLAAAEKEDTPYKYKRDQYPIFMPDKLKVFTSGAEASAFVLKMLITSGKVKPEDCIKRYNNIFKP